MTPVLSLRGVSKSFGGVRALDHVSFDVLAGEVHCLAGENGSGKSTIIKIVSGVHKSDAGEIVIGGKTQHGLSPRTAIAAGVQVIYQDFSLFPNLTVAENLALAPEVRAGRVLVSPARARLLAEQACARLGTDLPLQREVGRLPVAGRQLVAIARALVADAKLLIMDEPTAALTHQEVERLFARIESLKASGMAVLFVSHKMREMLDVADRLTVLRNGAVAAEGPMGDFSEAAITHAMTGHPPDRSRTEWTPLACDTVPRLETRGLSVPGNVADFDMRLMPGEIVGVAGLLGSGRTELALALFGLAPHTGDILVDGETIRIRTVADAIRAGIAYVPEDRLVEGVFASQSIARNLVAGCLDRLGRFGWIDQGRVRALALQAVQDMAINTTAIDRAVGTLSGGNQQRVVIGRWLLTQGKVLLLNGPTVGVDVGSKAGIHRKLRALAADGLSVLMISDDGPELAAHCHRVLLMHRGTLAAELSGAALTDAAITEQLRMLS